MTLLDFSQQIFGNKVNSYSPAQIAATETNGADVLYGTAQSDADSGEVEVLIDGTEIPTDPDDPDFLLASTMTCDTEELIHAGDRVTVVRNGQNAKAIALTPESTGVDAALSAADAANTTASAASETATAAQTTATAAQSAANSASAAAAAAEQAAAKTSAHFWSLDNAVTGVAAGAYVSRHAYDPDNPADALSEGYVFIDSDSVDVCYNGDTLITMYQISGGMGTGVSGTGDTAYTGDGNSYITTTEVLGAGGQVGVGVNTYAAGDSLPDGTTRGAEYSCINLWGDVWHDGGQVPMPMLARQLSSPSAMNIDGNVTPRIYAVLWGSGVLDYYIYAQKTGCSLTTAWGSAYYDATRYVREYNYPYGFASEPVVVATANTTNGGFCSQSSSGSASQTPRIWFTSFTKDTSQTCKLHLHVVGHVSNVTQAYMALKGA